MRILALLLAVLAVPLNAQELTAPEAGTLLRLIDSACIDIHPANGCEQVILLESAGDGDTADLIILTDRRTDPGGAPLLAARQIAYNGSMWGMSPTLEEGDGGTVLLHSEQSGIGRHPWFQTLTIGWLDEGFFVLTFAYSGYDRLSGSSFACDVDYRDGLYRANVAINDPESEEETEYPDSGQTQASPIPLSNLHAFTPMPDICTAQWDRYFALVP